MSCICLFSLYMKEENRSLSKLKLRFPKQCVKQVEIICNYCPIVRKQNEFGNLRKMLIQLIIISVIQKDINLYYNSSNSEYILNILYHYHYSSFTDKRNKGLEK